MDVNQQHQFLPNQLVTRADLANFLYHMAEKEGKIIENNCFSDIISGESDVDAITWACSTGIITGYEDGTFRPNQLIIRQELAAMLCRYARLFTKQSCLIQWHCKSFKMIIKLLLMPRIASMIYSKPVF